jgi:hypothetical protein
VDRNADDTTLFPKSNFNAPYKNENPRKMRETGSLTTATKLHHA